LLYAPPFTDIAPTGPEQVFDQARVARMFREIADFNANAGLSGLRTFPESLRVDLSGDLP